MSSFRDAVRRAFLGPLGPRGSNSYAGELAYTIDKMKSQLSRSGGSRIITTQGTRKLVPADPSVTKLKRINFSDMYMDEVHHGRVLLCRVVLAPVKVKAVMTVVSDPRGWCEKLSLYEYAPPSVKGSMADASSLLPLGTTLAIKEPFFKLGADNLPMVRVDTPSDVLPLDPSDPLVAGLTWDDEPARCIQEWMREAAELLGSDSSSDEEDGATPSHR